MTVGAEPIDRSKWGPGPWQDEPDRLEFEAHGLPCLIVRVPWSGHLCGYVAVPPGHPWHGKGYDDVRTKDDEWPDAHGGLTYAGACSGNICHVPKPGEPDDVWWFGFDHAHSGDSSPSDSTRPGFRDGAAYRTVGYVKSGCKRLAAQAAELLSVPSVCP